MKDKMFITDFLYRDDEYYFNEFEHYYPEGLNDPDEDDFDDAAETTKDAEEPFPWEDSCSYDDDHWFESGCTYDPDPDEAEENEETK